MTFSETSIPGAFVIGLEERRDDRGFFARAWCANEFEAHGLNPRLVQGNLSFNEQPGTLRGMHLQRAPHEEASCAKCARCAGCICSARLMKRQSASAAHAAQSTTSCSTYARIRRPTSAGRPSSSQQ